MPVRRKSSSTTQRLAVIGDPIAHSLSPLMQNFLIAHFDLPFQYEALRVSARALPNTVARLQRGELAGMNVTIPHKQAIIPLLDDLAGAAQRIGAVNTVVSSSGMLLGHNTDANGFRRALESAGINIMQEEILVLGAGGAAAAVLFSLLEMHAGIIYLSNRDHIRAQRLRENFFEEERETIRILPWSEKLELLQMSSVAIIINATSLGMSPNVETSPLPASAFRADMTAIDLVYNPYETRFLREAKQAGARTIPGLPMLIYQGVAALELWSKQRLDIEDVYDLLEKELRAPCKIENNQDGRVR